MSRRVYISGTTRELAQHRKAVYEACISQDFVPVMAEDFSANDRPILDKLLLKVADADLFVAILAHRYGFVPEGSELSITELEFNRARELGIRCFIFVMDEDHPVKISDIDTGEPAERLQAFRDRCRREMIVPTYKSPADLSEQVLRALKQLRLDQRRMRPESPLDAERAAYLQRLADLFRWINLGNLSPQVSGDALGLPLDALFIHLNVERDLPLTDISVRDVPTIDGMSPHIIADEEFDDVGAPRSVGGQLRSRTKGLAPNRRILRERVDIADVLKHPRVVVLGGPGSGKTTLLRYLARAVALRNTGITDRVGTELFPIYIRLAEYEDFYEKHLHTHLIEHRRTGLIDFASIACQTLGLPLSNELLMSEANAGRCLFLLDGLDEVFTSNRSAINHAIKDLAAKYSGVDHSRSPNPVFGCHIVTTSRLADYLIAPLSSIGTNGFDHFSLQPFDVAEIRQFADAWFEIIHAAGDPSDQRKEHADSLVKAIESNRSIRSLASNPLMLTMIALTYMHQARIPRRRVEIYRILTQTMFGTWRRPRPADLQLDERETTSLLMSVAFHIHLTSSSGLISRGDLAKVLNSPMTRRGELPFGDPRTAVDDFIGVQERIGLLQPLGPDVYGFLHLTFEEYFSARELARLWKQGQFKLDPYLHRPRWEEPVLLAAAHLSNEDDARYANDFVRGILEAGSPYEYELHRDLLLAARCLAEDVVVSRELSDRILDGLDRAYSTTIFPLNSRIRKVLSGTRGSHYEEATIRMLAKKLDTENSILRIDYLEAWFEFGDGEMQLYVLNTLIEYTRNPETHFAAVSALSRIGETSARGGVSDIYLALLRNPDPSVRILAAPTILRAGDTPESAGAVDVLLTLLNDPDSGIRALAARALGESGETAARPVVLDALLMLLRDTSSHLRDSAAEALGMMGASAASPAILDTLVSLIRDSKNRECATLVEALGRICDSAAVEEVLDVLLALLDDGNPRNRAAAATALGAVSRSGVGVGVLDRLAELLGHPKSRVRSAAAMAIGALGPAVARPDLIDVIAKLLDDPETRIAATTSLASLGAMAALPAIITTLAGFLGDGYAEVRRAGAIALGGFGEASALPEVIRSLATLLRDDELDVRQAAAEALGKIGPAGARFEILEDLAVLAYSPEAAGEYLEDVAFQALSTLVPFYQQGAGVESSREGMAAERINLASEWARWLMGNVSESVMPGRLPDGFPVLRLLKVRLRNIKGYADTGVVSFVDPRKVLPRPWSLLLGENAAGKTTFLRCVALAANGLGLANEVEPRASAYLRSGARKGIIEVLFGVQVAAQPSAAEMAEIAIGLEIRAGETAFRQMELSTEPGEEMTFDRVANAGRLGSLRNQTNLNFGLVCGYGATRGLTVDPQGIIRESDKAALERVRPLFDPLARLIDPEVLGRLLAAGDLSNFVNTPAREMDGMLRERLCERLGQVFPGLGGFMSGDVASVSIGSVGVPLRDLSDGYASLLALLGHLLHHSLALTGWKVDPLTVPGLVLIDELDLHLHPSWQRRVSRDLGAAFPNVQFIATSHSPIIAGSVPEESLLVLRGGGMGGVMVSSEALSVRGWRADQILTSDLFGLSTTRDLDAEKTLARYALLLNRRGPEDPEVRVIGREAARITGIEGEGIVDRQTYELVREVLTKRFGALPPETREMMLAKASLLLSGGADTP
jgi:HEAT repeat protein